MSRTPLARVLGQIDAARADLLAYPPTGVDWHARAVATATTLVPTLAAAAGDLRAHVDDVLNAHARLRQLWAAMRDVFDLPRVAEFDRLLSLDAELRADVTGELVSRILVGELCRRNPDLRANGASDYPDVYRSSAGYDFLPPFRRPRRGDVAGVVYGASLKGREGRPVRVPDGLEVKTCRRTIKVDCHHPHPGLHVVLVFDRRGTEYAVTDLAVSFLRTADYQEAARNTTATTVKFSFAGRSFVSLLGN